MTAFTQAATRAAAGICALAGLALLAGCEGALGTSPPHAAPADPSAEGADGQVELSWGAVTDATRYVIFWDNGGPDDDFQNVIDGIDDTSFVHTGLTNFQLYRYRVAAETSGGRGPESHAVSATPGPVPGAVEWAAVTSQDSSQTIHFATVAQATHYRIHFAQLESQLEGRRPAANFEEADTSPHVTTSFSGNTALFYRVIPMNDSRVGTGSPVAASAASVLSEFDAPNAGVALGDPNDDGCIDLPSAAGSNDSGACTGGFVARDLAASGLGDLVADGRVLGDARFADFTGDGFDDLFSSTVSAAGDPESIALLHVNDGEGNYETSAAVSSLAIGGFGGTLLVADIDNDGDIDLFLPNDHTRGDGARNWLLRNDGAAGFTDVAAAAGVDTNPAGAAFVPRGGQAVDFNEDGFVDFLFGSRLLVNDGDGTFSDGSAAAGMPVRDDTGLKLIDVDLDGDLDLLHRSGSGTRLHRNAGGVFGAGEILDPDPEPTFGFGMNACDINLDGFEDVLVASNLLSTGLGGPKLLVNVAGTPMPSVTQRGTAADPDLFVNRIDEIACGDVNRDGLVDVLARWGPSYRMLRGASTLQQRFRVRIVGADGERNQQGRIVRAVPQQFPDRVMTRVVESGSGMRSQGHYDLLFGAPWPGTYDVTVGFAEGDVTTTAVAGDQLTIFADGTVENDRPDAEE